MALPFTGELSKAFTAERLIKLLTMIGTVCVFAWGKIGDGLFFAGT